MSRSDMIYDDIDILYRNFPFLVEKIPPIPGKGTSFVIEFGYICYQDTYPDVS